MIDFNSSYIGLRPDILKYLEGKNKIVLDVGCATGSNGRVLLEKGIAAEVYGIEYDEEMAKEAAKMNTEIFQGNLNHKTFLKKVSSGCPMFDYIIFGDILEHLYEPKYTLLQLTRNLKPNGKIIISLPNIAHIETFIQIYIKGTWPKNPRGIFDKTHLRWFTKNDAFSMIEDCGLEVIEYQRKFRARDAIGSKFSYKYRFLKFLNPDWVTFQHLIYCGFAK